MGEKPSTRLGYSKEETDLVHQTCLFLATHLNDMMSEIRIVGGLVPTLIIGSVQSSTEFEPHVGTRDLDVGFELSILEKEHYKEVSKRLRSAGFTQDTNERGNLMRQRWTHPLNGIEIDFLIPPTKENPLGGRIQGLEKDMAAVITPGLELAFEDYEVVSISGNTGPNETATRDIYVCGPAAFILLKALAFRGRGENKDAYDLYFMLSHWVGGIPDIVSRWKRFAENDNALRALSVLREDFSTLDSVGPSRVNYFYEGEESVNYNLRADVRGLVTDFVGRAE